MNTCIYCFYLAYTFIDDCKDKKISHCYQDMNCKFLYLEFNPHLISNIEEPLWLCNLGFNSFNLKMHYYVHKTNIEFQQLHLNLKQDKL